jgi:hypothetical protein
VDPKPFKDNEVVKVLKEGRYSLVFQHKTEAVYNVSVLHEFCLVGKKPELQAGDLRPPPKFTINESIC